MGRRHMKRAGVRAVGACLVVLLLAAMPLSAVRAAEGQPALPSPEKLQAMTSETLMAFNAALQAKDFTAFHKASSSHLQRSASPAKLKAAFQGFIDEGINIAPIKGLKPIFDIKPAVDTRGVLMVAGHYPTRPSEVLFNLKYFMEGGQWRLLGINVNIKPVDDKTLGMPPLAKMGEMVRNTMLAFNEAVKANDFRAFHATLATPFRRTVSPERLQEAFKEIIDQKVAIDAVKTLAPVFNLPPYKSDDGMLVLGGYFPTDPLYAVFLLKYVQDAGAWRLNWMNVRVAPRPLPLGGKVPAPQGEALNALVLKSLLAFNDAVVAKDFKEFYAMLSVPFRKNVPVAKLQAAFQAFMDQGINIAGIEGIVPAFTADPTVGDDGLLRVQGTYPTKPSQVHFKLAYLYEHPVWRLVDINVNVK